MDRIQDRKQGNPATDNDTSKFSSNEAQASYTGNGDRAVIAVYESYGFLRI